MVATSPAQQRFRDYVKEVNTFTKFTEKAIKQGEDYTRYILQEWYYEILAIAVDNLRIEGDNEEIWLQRYADYVDAKIDYLCDKYNLSDFEPEEQDVFVENPNEGDLILGFPIITEPDCEARAGKVRGQILLTLDELAEYIEAIPPGAIAGIIVRKRHDGTVIGYSICGLQSSA